MSLQLDEPVSPFVSKPTVEFNLLEALKKIRHWLPTQAPIKDFVHHNTLHAFQHYHFDDAVVRAAKLFGARAYLPLEEYRARYDQGQISDAVIMEEIRRTLPEDLALQRFFGSEFTGESFIQNVLWSYREYSDEETAQAILKSESQSISEFEALFKALSERLDRSVSSLRYPRGKLVRENGIPLDQTVHPVLIRLVGSYLDQGISLWDFPHRKATFYEAVSILIRKSVFPIASFLQKKQVTPLLHLSSEQVAEVLLGKLCPDPKLRTDYLRETLLALPGWSGMVSLLEENPGLLKDPRPIFLVDFLAVKLLLEYQAIENGVPDYNITSGIQFEERAEIEFKRRLTGMAVLFLKLGIRGVQISSLNEKELIPFRRLLKFVSVESIGGIWHRSMEKTSYVSALSTIEANAKRNSSAEGSQAHLVTAVFCIDDREFSLRYYLEAADPFVTTAATAGFFGVDFLFQSIHDSHPVKLCPLPVRPKHVVREKHRSSYGQPARKKFLGKATALWLEHSSSPLLGWLITSVSVPWIFVRLVLRTFHPRLFAKSVHRDPVQVDSEFEFIRSESTEPGTPLFQGYAYEEMADRVANQLRATGLIERLTPVVVLVAHGSSSVNNPHYSAYDCGACSGRPGAANAKTFALMANHPEVRKILKERAIDIPEETVFVGAFHDTCRDSITFYDQGVESHYHKKLIRRFKQSSLQALRNNAKERTRRFESVPLEISPELAHQEVEYRSLALFEPRPELNHANNAFCIVGRRYLTQRLFMDRRAFLQSYNPKLDVDGKLLDGILSAVVPVCAGINLEYLFSKIDNDVYGSGTKLPHNIASLIGVMNGVDDDLRTGLPKQMIEAHDPVRCLFLIEQYPDVVLKLLERNRAIGEWFDHEWAFLVTLDPESLKMSKYKPGGKFEPFAFEGVRVPIVSEVLEYVSSARDNLKFALLTSHHASSTSLEEQL